MSALEFRREKELAIRFFSDSGKILKNADCSGKKMFQISFLCKN